MRGRRGLPSAVEWAHWALERRVKPGAVVVDATAGNGGDTVFLARCVQPGGRVMAMDVQACALERTREALRDAGLEGAAELILGGHEEWERHLSPEWKGGVDAVVFNLGFLPGGEKQCTTRWDTTLRALGLALEWLSEEGLLVVVAYPGHEAGAREAEEVREWMGALAGEWWEVQRLQAVNRGRAAPELWMVQGRRGRRRG